MKQTYIVSRETLQKLFMDIETFITEYPDWYQEENELVAGFEFKTFAAVTEKVKALLTEIASSNHHPTVTFGHNSIEISTTTHDAGSSITEKDMKLAKMISEIMAD